MKADRSSQDNTLAFPSSLEEARGPEVEGPSRFARALKRARFARGWTQAILAAQLAIPKRSIVSWETGERIPSVGMVMLLVDALFPNEDLSLNRELITAYVVDDLERLELRRGSQRDQDDPLLERIQRVKEQALRFPPSASQASTAIGEVLGQAKEQLEAHEPSRLQKKVDEQQALEPLFALIEQLRQHPELISVARDFIRELAPGE